MTAQTTLAAILDRDGAFERALKRIEDIMLPGARALAATRTDDSPFYITEERDLTGRAPFTGQTALVWKDSAHIGSDAHRRGIRAPFDGARASYSVQIIVPSDITPTQLAELARLARLFTQEVICEANLTTASQVAALAAERASLDAIATGADE